MSALVWAVESVILGLWAMVLVNFNSNPFHTFISRTHVLISGFTLVAQLYTAARALPIGPMISEAFVCAVFSLILVYLMAVLDPKNFTDSRLFSLPVLGNFLPIDACIGLAWFAAAAVSAIGMALSERGRPSALMFHHFGYHMLIVPPSFLVFWLYNYNATSVEPVSQGIALLYQGVRITHTLYTFVLIGIWGAFVLLQFTGECLQFDAEWPSFDMMTANGGLRYVLSVFVKLLGRAACILIPLSAAFTARASSQQILAWVLTGIGGANAFDWLSVVDSILGKSRPIPPLETIHRADSALPLLRSRYDPAALALDGREKAV